jgi:hypothetical protein
MYATGCVSLQQARIEVSPGIPKTGVGTQSVGEYIRGLGGGMGIRSAQERVSTPVPSDEEGEEMTYNQRRLIRRFRNGGAPSTARGAGAKNFNG